jgi:hypothetical protein
MKLTDTSIVIGVDNGLDGGLCALSAFDGSLIHAIPMPTRQIGGKREVDPSAVYVWATGLGDFSSRILFAIEEPLKHAKSSQAMRSMGISFGLLCATAEMIGYHIRRIQVLDWQGPVLGRVARGKTKQRALEVASARWPDETWLASSRHRTPHDGMVDAALLAEFARNTYTTVKDHGS